MACSHQLPSLAEKLPLSLSQEAVRVGSRRKKNSISFPCYMFLTYIEGKISRRISGIVSLRRRALEFVHYFIPVDSLNVPNGTSRRFRHFKHWLRSLFEVDKKKDL